MGNGSVKEHISAFARQGAGKVVLVVVPRFLTHLVKGIDQFHLGKEVWGNATVVIPEEIKEDQFINIFTGERATVIEREGRRSLTLEEVLANFPVALLAGKRTQNP
jgi:maltooligosyltrehalose synthase